jgi:hypothetical protein
MSVHSATCSCSIELYKQWYNLADFLPNWDISRGFLYISLITLMGGAGDIIFHNLGAQWKDTPSYCNSLRGFFFIFFAERISEAAWAGRGSGDMISMTIREMHRVRQSAKLFLKSSELGLPQPLTRRRVCPPPPCLGGGARWRKRGWENPNSDEGTHCGTLYIYVLCGELYNTFADFFRNWNISL